MRWWRKLIVNPIFLYDNHPLQEQFAYYGDSASVPINHILLFDGLGREESYLFEIPFAATAFAVADVHPIRGYWSSVIEAIRYVWINNEYIGLYQSMNNYNVIKFEVLNVDFTTHTANK